MRRTRRDSVGQGKGKHEYHDSLPRGGQACPPTPGTGEPVHAAGAAVPRSPYWLRRLRDGDLTTARPAEKPAEKEGVKEKA